MQVSQFLTAMKKHYKEGSPTVHKDEAYTHSSPYWT
jgi:hypothetical protein